MNEIKSFFDKNTWTVTYVVFNAATKDAVVIDPVLDYDPRSSKITTASIDKVVSFIKEKDLELHYILETHAHADHLSASQIIKESFPTAKTAIGAKITQVQALFKGVFDLPADFAVDGSQFDELLEGNKPIQAGSMTFEVIPSPGHTPACMSFMIDDILFAGDALFMPDVGTGRCDFPGGSSEDMYDSVMNLYKLPDETRVFIGHDYPEGKGREATFETTIAEQKANNVALPATRDRAEFIKWRNARDKSLAAPQLLFQSVQINVDAGALPKPHANEKAYLRIPINVFRPQAQENIELSDV